LTPTIIGIVVAVSGGVDDVESGGVDAVESGGVDAVESGVVDGVGSVGVVVVEVSGIVDPVEVDGVVVEVVVVDPEPVVAVEIAVFSLVLQVVRSEHAEPELLPPPSLDVTDFQRPVPSMILHVAPAGQA
jgi:hypothetical protein